MGDVIKLPRREVVALLWCCAECGGDKFRLELCDKTSSGIVVCCECYLTTEFNWGYQPSSGPLDLPQFQGVKR
jgi:hypothetical protein